METKQCCRCKNDKPLNEFDKNANRRTGVESYCKTCRSNTRKTVSYKKYNMWSDARKRARKKNIPFNINKNDIIIPEICPILNIPLVFGDKIIHDASPTLDRIDPSRGYIPGNIQVISNKANRIKTNASIAEIELVFEWFKRNQIL